MYRAAVLANTSDDENSGDVQVTFGGEPHHTISA